MQATDQPLSNHGHLHRPCLAAPLTRIHKTHNTIVQCLLGKSNLRQHGHLQGAHLLCASQLLTMLQILIRDQTPHLLSPAGKLVHSLRQLNLGINPGHPVEAVAVVDRFHRQKHLTQTSIDPLLLLRRRPHLVPGHPRLCHCWRPSLE